MCRATAERGRNHESLVAQPPLDDLTGPGRDDEVIGVDRAGDHGFTKPWARVDDSLAAPACDRICREHHARYGGVDHPLNDDGKMNAVRIDGIGCAIRHCAVRPQRRPAAVDRIEHGIDADDVEIGVLLSGEARKRQVLCRG